MKKFCQILKLKSDEELFEQIKTTFKEKGILQWDYFVNWNKVYKNIRPLEKELNLLNVLIGKENIEKELIDLILEYPKVVNAIPILLALRFKKKVEQKIDMLVDIENFIYENFDLSITTPSKEEAKQIAIFFIKSGLGSLLKEEKIKNLVDYATGVEVGLDSNGRKNRGGTMMENVVETYVAKTCEELGIEYLSQANAKKIKSAWNLDIKVDKSSRNLDFAINKNGQLYFIECNFYGGGGSKLKSTATEYVKMNEYWNEQNITFIWITDGAGWKSTLKPLREYFDKSDFLLNLEMLKSNVLFELIS